MANNEQTNLAAISTTNQTRKEPYIVPFDSENGMLIEVWLDYFNNACTLDNKDDNWKIVNISKYLNRSALTQYINSCLNISNFGELCSLLIEKFFKPNVACLVDFSQLQLKNYLEQYFHQKLNYGKQLGLSPQLVLEGLTNGIPANIKQLMTINLPTTPTEWLMVATRLMKTQAPINLKEILSDKMCPFDQDKILLNLKIATLFDPTSKILIECVPNISQISKLNFLTIEDLGPTTTHIFNMDCHHIHVVFGHNKEFPMLIVGNYNVPLINIKTNPIYL
ncbi:uncharacterized protein TNCV_2588701 [Trichonephila clavipes]|nr:uncharacterized protein TNCV_2588701 [Trichonephila clavipes]